MQLIALRRFLLAVLGWVFLLSASPALAVVNDLTVTGLPRDTAVSLTQDGNPALKAEAKSDSKGVARFALGGFNLPGGSNVRVSAGGESRLIPALADGSNTRDFRSPATPDAAKGPGHTWEVEVELGPGFRIMPKNLGRAYAGVFLNNDERISATQRTIVGFNPKINLTGDLFGQKAQFKVEGFYGSASNSDAVPVGGAPVGITGDHGFAGIALGATGADLKGWVQDFGGEINAVFPNLLYRRQWNKSEFGIGSRLTFGYGQTDYRTTFDSPTFAGIHATRHREVDQVYLGPGITLQKNHELTNNLHFYAGINADVLYNISDLDTRQHIACNLCPAGQQNLRISTEDRNSGWIFRPGASMGLEYEMNSWSFGVNGSYQYWHQLPLLRDRESPADRPPGLVAKGVHRFNLGLSIKYAF